MLNLEMRQPKAVTSGEVNSKDAVGLGQTIWRLTRQSGASRSSDVFIFRRLIKGNEVSEADQLAVDA